RRGPARPAAPDRRGRHCVGPRGGRHGWEAAIARRAQAAVDRCAAVRTCQRLLPPRPAAGPLLRRACDAARTRLRPSPQTAFAAGAGRRRAGPRSRRLAAATTASGAVRVRGGVRTRRRRLSGGTAAWLPAAAGPRRPGDRAAAGLAPAALRNASLG